MKESEDKVESKSRKKHSGPERGRKTLILKGISHLNNFSAVISARKMVTVPVQGLVHLIMNVGKINK